MKKKELRFTANFQEDFAYEVMKQDAKTINEITPGFQLPLRIELPGQDNSIKLIEAKTMLSMPLKKKKDE